MSQEKDVQIIEAGYSKTETKPMREPYDMVHIEYLDINSASCATRTSNRRSNLSNLATQSRWNSNSDDFNLFIKCEAVFVYFDIFVRFTTLIRRINDSPTYETKKGRYFRKKFHKLRWHKLRAKKIRKSFISWHFFLLLELNFI